MATALRSMAFGVLLAKWNGVAWVCSAKKQTRQASVSFCSCAWQRCLLCRRAVNAERPHREGRGMERWSGTCVWGAAATGRGPSQPWAGGGTDLPSPWDSGLPAPAPTAPVHPLPVHTLRFFHTGPIVAAELCPQKDTQVLTVGMRRAWPPAASRHSGLRLTARSSPSPVPSGSDCRSLPQLQLISPGGKLLSQPRL